MSARTAEELKYCNSMGAFNKTIIPLALVGYEIAKANSYAPRWLSTISYPTRTRGIILKYTTRHAFGCAYMREFRHYILFGASLKKDHCETAN